MPLPALSAPAKPPRWVTVTAGLGCVFLAAVAWAMATVGADMAGAVTDPQWDSPP